MHNLREEQNKAGQRYVSSAEAYFIIGLEDRVMFHPIG